MKHSKYSIFSLVASTICIIGLLILNYNLAQDYLAAGLKTQALFGLTELVRLHLKFYYIPFGLISVILVTLALTKKERKWSAIASIIWCLVAIASFFIRYWTYMV